MKALADSPANLTSSHHTAKEKEETRKIVLSELERILASPSFRSAARSKQFLSYVVHHQLDGHAELLKERTIGTEVFLRPLGYATGDDPVVRVQAGEVRRRLDQYYQTASPHEPHLRIELPVGSYSPVFHFTSTASSMPVSVRVVVPSPPASTAPVRSVRFGNWSIVAICAVLVLSTAVVVLAIRPATHQKSVFDQFWDPVFTTQQPALICLGKGVTYRPGPELYRKYALKHPGTFQTEIEKSSMPLPLDPDEKISWSDMLYYEGYGVAIGDVSAAVKFSTLLGKMGKPSQVRIGPNYSFEDLRNSPAIVVGAFNNRWTIDTMSNLHFAFVEEDGRFKIREQTQGGRVWESQFNKSGVLQEDFAIVARLLDSKTGQFTIAAAGLRDSGTQAAGEFASNPAYLEKELRNAPSDWQKKNLEIIIQTTVTDSFPGPPHVLASYSW